MIRVNCSADGNAKSHENLGQYFTTLADEKRSFDNRSGDFSIRTARLGRVRHEKLTTERACCEELANQSDGKTKDVKSLFITRNVMKSAVCKSTSYNILSETRLTSFIR